MEKSKVIIILFLFLGIMNVEAQDDVPTRKMDDTGFFLSLGGDFNNFQDLKYSALRYDGIGGNLELHFKQSTPKAIWSTGLSTQVSSEKANLFDNGTALVVYPQIHFSYLIFPNQTLFSNSKTGLS